MTTIATQPMPIRGIIADEKGIVTKPWIEYFRSIQVIATAGIYVSTVAIDTANGFSGSSDGLVPLQTLTLNTTVNGLAYGNGTALGATSIVLPIYYNNGTISTSMDTGRIIGRSSDSTGVMEEIDVGNHLALSSGTLSGDGIADSVIVSTIGSDTTSHVALFTDATGTLGCKTDDGITYDAVSGHITSKVILNAGGTASGSASLYNTSGSLLSTAAVGASEFDGVSYYDTITTRAGRNVRQVYNEFVVPSNKTGITTSSNFFGTSGSCDIPLISSQYHIIEMELFFRQNTNNAIVTFVFTPSATPVDWGVTWDECPATGVQQGAGAVTPANDKIGFDWYRGAASVLTVTTPTLTADTNHTVFVRMYLLTDATASQNLVTTVSTAAGTLTAYKSSRWSCRIVPPNTGNYV